MNLNKPLLLVALASVCLLEAGPAEGLWPRWLRGTSNGEIVETAVGLEGRLVAVTGAANFRILPG